MAQSNELHCWRESAACRRSTDQGDHQKIYCLNHSCQMWVKGEQNQQWKCVFTERQSSDTTWELSLEKSQQVFHSLVFKTDLFSLLTFPGLVTPFLEKKFLETGQLRRKAELTRSKHSRLLRVASSCFDGSWSLKALLLQFEACFAQAELFSSSDPNRAVNILML